MLLAHPISCRPVAASSPSRVLSLQLTNRYRRAGGLFFFILSFLPYLLPEETKPSIYRGPPPDVLRERRDTRRTSRFLGGNSKLLPWESNVSVATNVTPSKTNGPNSPLPILSSRFAKNVALREKGSW